jgi:hypothetical protein
MLDISLHLDIILDISLHLGNHIVFIFNRINNHFPKLPNNHIVFIFFAITLYSFSRQTHCIHFQAIALYSFSTE